jgi:hypothetical protein
MAAAAAVTASTTTTASPTVTTSTTSTHVGSPTGTATAYPNSAATHPRTTALNVSLTATNADMPAAVTAVPPAMPAHPAAPSEAAAHRITTPVESRPVPAVIVPAIIPSAEEELDWLHDSRDGSRKETGGQCDGWAGQTEHSERNRYSSRVNPMSHVFVHPLNVPNGSAGSEEPRQRWRPKVCSPPGSNCLFGTDAEDAAAGWLAGVLYNHFGYYESRSPPVSARTFSIC